MKHNVYLPMNIGGVLHQEGGRHWSDLSLSNDFRKEVRGGLTGGDFRG